jgi:hypothetical protein
MLFAFIIQMQNAKTSDTTLPFGYGDIGMVYFESLHKIEVAIGMRLSGVVSVGGHRMIEVQV